MLPIRFHTLCLIKILIIIPLGLRDSAKGWVSFSVGKEAMKMDVNMVTDLVSNVAFPIAAFVMMYYSNTKTIEELRKTIEENSLIMAKLAEKLDNFNDKEV
jgi:cell shape-determining protein MreD